MERLREKEAIYEPRREAGNRLSLTALSRNRPSACLDCALEPPELSGDQLLLFKPAQCMGPCSSGPCKLLYES